MKRNTYFFWTKRLYQKKDKRKMQLNSKAGHFNGWWEHIDHMSCQTHQWQISTMYVICQELVDQTQWFTKESSQWGLQMLTSKFNHIPSWSSITLSSNSKDTARTNSRRNFNFDIFLKTYTSFTGAFPTVFRYNFTLPTTIWTYRNLILKERYFKFSVEGKVSSELWNWNNKL